MGTSENVSLWSTTASSNDTADAGINWAEGQAANTVNNSARGMMAGIAKWKRDKEGALTTGGSANAQTLTTATGLTALADGIEVGFVAGYTNTTTTPTLNVDSLGAKKMRKVDTTGEVALAAGDVTAAGHYIARYDASADSTSGAWIILNPATNALGTSTAVSTELDRISSTQGVVLYRGSSAWSALATGTSGYALLTQGSSANPAWGFVNSTASMSNGDFFANTSSRLLTAAGVWNDAAPVSKGNTSTSIGMDLSTFINATCTATGTFTMTFSNMKAGQAGSIWITQDGTGSRVMTLAVTGGSAKVPNGTTLVLSTTAAAVDRLDYICRSSTVMDFALTKNLS